MLCTIFFVLKTFDTHIDPDSDRMNTILTMDVLALKRYSGMLQVHAPHLSEAGVHDG